MAERIGWALALGALGAILGSFLATLAVRWPAGRSVMRGRSACDGCGRTLRAGELVPLVSAWVSSGRCRTCDAAIDPLHDRVEALAALAGAAAGAAAPGIEGAAGAAFGWLLVTLAALDVRAFWLPDRLVGPLAILGLSSGAAGFEPPLPDRLIGGAGGFALLWSVGWAYQRLRGREGLGGGDPKLFGAIGLWLGWRLLPAVLVVAGLIGLGVVACAAIRGRRIAADAALPFGALLAAAAYPAWLLMVAMRP